MKRHFILVAVAAMPASALADGLNIPSLDEQPPAVPIVRPAAAPAPKPAPVSRPAHAVAKRPARAAASPKQKVAAKPKAVATEHARPATPAKKAVAKAPAQTATPKQVNAVKQPQTSPAPMAKSDDVQRFAEAPKPLADSLPDPEDGNKPDAEETTVVSARPVRKQYEPTVIVSGQETHEVVASASHENTFTMPRKVLQAFSSRKLFVEIRGPVVLVRVPSEAGRDVDLQILTDDFHVENFLLHMDATLPSQKFIVRKSDDEDAGSDPLNHPTLARKNSQGKYGGAIDTLILIANGKTPKGFARKTGEPTIRDFRGLHVIHLGSFVRRDAEFAVYQVTNATDAPVAIKEWNLHNDAVLGSVERVRAVEFMSLDRHSLKPGESTYLYVAMNHRRGKSYE